MRRGNNLAEIRLVARSATGYTLICPRGNLSPTATLLPSFLHTTATAIATTTPFRSAPATPICSLSAFPNAGLRYQPSSLATRRARNRQVSREFLTPAIRQGSFFGLPSSFSYRPRSPFLSRSSRPPFFLSQPPVLPVGGIRESASHRYGC